MPVSSWYLWALDMIPKLLHFKKKEKSPLNLENFIPKKKKPLALGREACLNPPQHMMNVYVGKALYFIFLRWCAISHSLTTPPAFLCHFHYHDYYYSMNLFLHVWIIAGTPNSSLYDPDYFRLIILVGQTRKYGL